MRLGLLLSLVASGESAHISLWRGPISNALVSRRVAQLLYRPVDYGSKFGAQTLVSQPLLSCHLNDLEGRERAFVHSSS